MEHGIRSSGAHVHLLLTAILWFFSSNSVQGKEWSCSVDSGSPVTLQAMQSGEMFSGNLAVSAFCTKEHCWSWSDEHKLEVMPLCVEVLSTHLIQSFICGGLGLQYTGYWSMNSQSSECYSMKYQQVVAKGRGAKLVCHTPLARSKETLLNISNGESVNIAFPLPLPKEEASWPQPGDNTGLGFMMQVNRTAAENSHGTTTTICVYTLLNLSNIEEKDQIVEFWNTSTSTYNFGHHKACNLTVNLANFSQTVTEICEGDDIPLPSSATAEAQEKLRCDSRNHLVKELVMAFIILILLLVVLIFGSMLVYNHCKARCPKGVSNSTLLSNDYTGTNSRLATDYIPMEMDPSTAAQGTNGHVTYSEISRNRPGARGIYEDTEVKYDELTSCSQRSVVKNSDEYSHLSYNN